MVFFTAAPVSAAASLDFLLTGTRIKSIFFCIVMLLTMGWCRLYRGDGSWDLSDGTLDHLVSSGEERLALHRRDGGDSSLLSGCVT